MRANALHLILQRWDREGLWPNQSLYGIFPFSDDEAVKLVRYADVAQNLSQSMAGALHESRIVRALLRMVQCSRSAQPFWAEV